MDPLTVDQVLETIRQRLNLSKETEQDLLAEIRAHLEDAVASSPDGDERAALLNAADRFGADQVGPELQQEHAGWESLDAVIATALPVLFALILRWLAFNPDGSALSWRQFLTRPGFWIVAFAALLIPFLHFRRWRFVLVGWGFFWLLTVIFVVFPSLIQW